MKQKNQKRILFYIGSLLAGGKERRLLELLKYLKANSQIEIMLVLTVDKIHYIDFLNLGVPIKILDENNKGFKPQIISRFYRLCKDFQPDIIHTWGAKQTLYTLPAVFGLNIPLINSQIASAPPKIHKTSIDYWINKINFQFSNLILSNSIAGIEAYEPPKNKSKVIYNGLSFSRFKNLPDKESIKAKYQVNTPYLVVMSASFSPNKDHKLFLEVAKKVTALREDISFLGIGAHDHPDNPIFAEIMEKSKAYPRINYPGRINEVEALVNACDLGLMFSNTSVHGEGISNSIMEYMALAKPVIANDAGGTKELVFNNQNGYLITNETVDQIVTKVIELIDNKEKSRGFGKKGKQIIKESFTIEKMGKGFMKVYKEFIAGKVSFSTEENNRMIHLEKPEYVHSNS
ncbi:glycosyltransferase [Echinicola salinicaeni]|uniref:glycosyltransferase n=1 Tax=Echinicola salinicaeni TaxID=2762757 RepID=UPI001646EBEA|nr:glycosyltransferase [Echinicola salinicaeni]